MKGPETTHGGIVIYGWNINIWKYTQPFTVTYLWCKIDSYRSSTEGGRVIVCVCLCVCEDRNGEVVLGKMDSPEYVAICCVVDFCRTTQIPSLIHSFIYSFFLLSIYLIFYSLITVSNI